MAYSCKVSVIVSIMPISKTCREGHSRQHENGFPRPHPDFLNKAIKKQVSSHLSQESTDLLLDGRGDSIKPPLEKSLDCVTLWVSHGLSWVSVGSVEPNFKLHYQTGNSGFSSPQLFPFPFQLTE